MTGWSGFAARGATRARSRRELEGKGCGDELQPPRTNPSPRGDTHPSSIFNR